MEVQSLLCAIHLLPGSDEDQGHNLYLQLEGGSDLVTNDEFSV